MNRKQIVHRWLSCPQAAEYRETWTFYLMPDHICTT